MSENSRQPVETKLWHVLCVLAIIVSFISYGLGVAGSGAHIPLFAAAIVVGGFAVFVMKYPWDVLQDSMFESIRIVSIAVILLYIIGMVIATWILAGVVPSMIYYGLQVIHPRFFLVSAALLCSMVSLPTGSSWTTAGTVGVALMGIGEGLGIPSHYTGGAVLSGAYFGDKLSPLSDTSNLAIAVAKADLIDHVKHMLWTSVPAFVCALIGFLILGFSFGSSDIQTDTISSMLTTLGSNYNISGMLLLVPIIVIAIVVMKVPAIPGLFIGAVLGGITAIFTQDGIDVPAVIDAMHYGVTVSTGNEMVDSLLSRGGMSGMYDTICLIFGVALLSGVLDATKITYVLTQWIISFATNVGSLVLATVASGLMLNFLLADQYISIMMTGKMFQKSYEDRNLATKNLSRALQDSAAVTSAFVPWNTCGAYMIATLGLAPWTYIPYTFFNLLMPIFSVLAAYFDYTMTTVDQEKLENEKAKS